MSVYDEIKTERDEQDAKWGGAAHDDEHDELEWLGFVLEHAAKALSGVVRAERGVMPDESRFHERPWKFTIHVPAADGRNPRAYRERLIQVAALAVAAVEAFDRRAAQRS